VDAKKAVELLKMLRADQMRRLSFEDRSGWATGVIKGIDLSIWQITTHESREATMEPESSGFWGWFWLIFVLAGITGGIYWVGTHGL
jgi:hypothetical protein